ncbi:MAG: hypothetical protein ACRDNL_07825, partial [Spirillospora sp.]
SPAGLAVGVDEAGAVIGTAAGTDLLAVPTHGNGSSAAETETETETAADDDGSHADGGGAG